MIDLFYKCEYSDVESYADDTKPNSCVTDIVNAALELQASSTNLFRWFKNNHLKPNPGKSHILLSSKKPEIVSVDGSLLVASSYEKLLGVTIDSELKFEMTLQSYISKLAKNLTLSAVDQVPCD